MTYIKAADIVIEADGFDYPYFKTRTAEYLTDKCQPDLKVKAIISDEIDIPDVNVIVSKGERHFFESDTKSGFYDLYNGKCIALITADKNWNNVIGELTDISTIGGADNDIRRFNMLGEVFRYHVLNHNGIIYHSSTLAYRNNGIMFSAPSGTGKSTHTSLWLECFPDEAMVINDDSPAVRVIDGKAWIYGTPWSGTSEINKNVKVPAKALVFLERNAENSADNLGNDRVLQYLISGLMLLPVFGGLMDKTLSNLSAIAEVLPLYKLKCNISHEAVYTIKNKIFE